jgi:hypothetical protein
MAIVIPSICATNCEILTASFTRPGGGDVNAYAINDMISDSTSAPTLGVFANAARLVGGSGYIVSAQICTDQAACIAPFRLYLYTTAVTPINDNAPFTLLYTNRSPIRVGYIDFSAVSQEGTGSTSAFAEWTGQKLYVCNAASTSLYYQLVAKAGFTPASGQGFTITLGVDKN